LEEKNKRSILKKFNHLSRVYHYLNRLFGSFSGVHPLSLLLLDRGASGPSHLRLVTYGEPIVDIAPNAPRLHKRVIFKIGIEGRGSGLPEMSVINNRLEVLEALVKHVGVVRGAVGRIHLRMADVDQILGAGIRKCADLRSRDGVLRRADDGGDVGLRGNKRTERSHDHTRGHQVAEVTVNSSSQI
jgi:hypothetical protein